MKLRVSVLLGIGLMATTLTANANVMTFGTDSTGATYTEAGMTITATSAEPVRVGVYSGNPWYLDDDGVTETFELTTGGLFDLLSVLRVHVDPSDPVVWKGFLGATLLISTSYNSGQGTVFNFAGFTGLDRVTMSVSGTYTDPAFDDLTFNAASVSVPTPSSLALLGLGLVASLAAFRRRRRFG